MAAPDGEFPQFKAQLVEEVFKLVQDQNTRASPTAIALSQEYLRLFATEAIHRAAEVAKRERAEGGDVNLVEVRHLEKVVAGLLLDF